jgi:release factor glutamine methyltransferase
MAQDIACTVSDALKRATRRLSANGIAGARQDAQILLSHVTGYSRAQQVADIGLVLSPAAEMQFESLVDRRVNREPVSHLLGQREFWSLPFIVNSAVLDPRPDSETLVEAALDYCPEESAELSILDFGTGSGCLLLSFLKERPNVTGVGLDISADALGVAQQNAAQLGLSSRVRFLRGNWGACLSGRFDIIISNPPYIPRLDIVDLEPEVFDFEPLVALDGGEDGLATYRQLMPEIQRLLSPEGIGVVEIGTGQKDAVSRILKESGLVMLEVRADLAGIDRCIIFRTNPIFTVT